MLDVVKKLKSKVYINNLVSELGVNNAEKLIEKINSAIALKKEKEENEKQKIIENKEALKKIKKDLKKAGLSISDLSNDQPRKTIKPKYKLVVNGEEYLWTGRGRMPEVFKSHKNNLNNLLIKE